MYFNIKVGLYAFRISFFSSLLIKKDEIYLKNKQTNKQKQERKKKKERLLIGLLIIKRTLFTV